MDLYNNKAFEQQWSLILQNYSMTFVKYVLREHCPLQFSGEGKWFLKTYKNNIRNRIFPFYSHNT